MHGSDRKADSAGGGGEEAQEAKGAILSGKDEHCSLLQDYEGSFEHYLVIVRESVQRGSPCS